MKRVLGAFILAAAIFLPATRSHAQVGITVHVGPPVVAYPAYAVPPCPGPGYIWAPGYYAGAVWVPGRWVYRAYYGPHYYRPYGYYDRHDRDDWYRHDHGHHYGWYKHHDDWDR
jgi:hypothetical protein